ncbi:MAG: ATP-binding protein [Deltaproteobacteria bacterium]|nr:MAG: ATP-binding protein [Deltaproteobacteria bacterium]
METVEPYGSSLDHVRDLLEVVRLHLLHRGVVRDRSTAEAGVTAGTGALTRTFLAENVEPHRVPMDMGLADAILAAMRHAGARAAATEEELRWELLVEAFDLDALEAHLLLTAVAPHFSSGFSDAFTQLVPGFQAGRIPAGALADLVATGDARRWDALAALHPDARLARAGLLMTEPTGPGQAQPYTQSPMWASPVVIDFLTREAEPTLRPACLAGMARILESRRGIAELPTDEASRQALAALAEVERGDADADAEDAPPAVAVVITGGLAPAAVAEAVAHEAGRDVAVLSYLADRRGEGSATAYRQTALYARLHDLALVFEVPAGEEVASAGAIAHLIEMTTAAPQLILASPTPIPALPQLDRAALRVVQLPAMGEVERRWVWEDALGAGVVAEDTLAQLATSFGLGEPEIREVARTVLAEQRAGAAALSYEPLARVARKRLSAGIEGVAERIETDADFADLIVDDACREELVAISAYVQHLKVVERKHSILSRRGRGTSALFHGPSGTGKTFAAAVVARATRRDLYRIDTARVVDKYIGETEKKLDRVFALAEASDSIILFDEADSLFAKRMDVSSSTDRYANMQVNFLLQRMESYSGMSILTTNLLESIDQAFRRRIQFQIHFPKPSVEQRHELWGHFLGKIGSPPVDDDGLWELAESFEMTGAHVRNAVIKAAVLSSSRDRAVDAELLWEAATIEYKALGGLVRAPRRS